MEIIKAWAIRLFGLGLAAASPYVARYLGPDGAQQATDLAGTIGSVVGALVLTKVAPVIAPTVKKMEPYLPKSLRR